MLFRSSQTVDGLKFSLLDLVFSKPCTGPQVRDQKKAQLTQHGLVRRAPGERMFRPPPLLEMSNMIRPVGLALVTYEISLVRLEDSKPRGDDMICGVIYYQLVHPLLVTGKLFV